MIPSAPPTAAADCILSNATLILPDALLPGTIVLRAGRIAEIQPGRSTAAGAHDMDGDYLMPGVVDVHTDNLERQVQPRSSARWPVASCRASPVPASTRSTWWW